MKKAQKEIVITGHMVLMAVLWIAALVFSGTALMAFSRGIFTFVHGFLVFIAWNALALNSRSR